VHTDPASGQVLQEAIGLPAVAPPPFGPKKARGALAPHVEFKRPLSQRLSDEEWLTLLQSGFAPAREAARRLVAASAAGRK
jgi:hypothetical protein